MVTKFKQLQISIVMNPDHTSEALKRSLEESLLEQRRRSLTNNGGNSIEELHPDGSAPLQHIEVDRRNHHYQGMLGSAPTELQPVVNMSHENHMGAYDPFRLEPNIALLNHQRLQSQNLPNLASHLNITRNMLIDAPFRQILPSSVARQVPQVIYDPLLVPVAYNPLTASPRRIEYVRHLPDPHISTLQVVPNRNVESQIHPFRPYEVALPAFGRERAALNSYGVDGQQGRSTENHAITQHSMLENTLVNQGMDIMADAENQTERNESSRKKSRAPKRRPSKTFEEHFENLVEFKAKYGHCNVPHRYKENPSLGNWCNNIRTSWRIMKDGGTPSSYKLTMDQIRRLDEIGFRWRVYSNRQAFRIDREYKT